MTQLTSDADKVALVQTAYNAPMMIFAMVSGSMADMFDRRSVALVAIFIGLIAASALSIICQAQWITPEILLIFCFILGSSLTLFAPAWQSSVRDQIPSEHIPAAVGLNSISYNLGRSVGPAVGGMIVAVAGAVTAFVVNALSYLPMLAVLWAWRTPQRPVEHDRQNLVAAVWTGVSHAARSSPIRVVLARTTINIFGASAIMALMPLVVTRHLHADAFVYGCILATFGVGAIVGAALLPYTARHFSSEASISACGITFGLVITVMALSSSSVLVAVVMIPAGIAWTTSSTTYNVILQLAAPYRVLGRILATYQTAFAGGLAIGSWTWGMIAVAAGLKSALIAAAAYTALGQLIGRWVRMPAMHDVAGFRRDAI